MYNVEYTTMVFSPQRISEVFEEYQKMRRATNIETGLSAGISESGYRKIKKAKDKDHHFSTIVNICEYLGINIYDFMYQTDISNHFHADGTNILLPHSKKGIIVPGEIGYSKPHEIHIEVHHKNNSKTNNVEFSGPHCISYANEFMKKHTGVSKRYIIDIL